MSLWVKIVGSAEVSIWLTRVPCVGEYVAANGLPRRVARVEHHPQPWPFSLPGHGGEVQFVGSIVSGAPSMSPLPAATITVEDA